MRTKDGTYDPKSEAHSFRKTEFVKIPNNKLIDIIPTIVESSRDEMEILESWKEYYRSLDVPFSITRRLAMTSDRKLSYLTLWKEIRVQCV